MKRKNWLAHAHNTRGSGTMKIRNKTELEARRLARKYAEEHFPGGIFSIELEETDE